MSSRNPLQTNLIVCGHKACYSLTHGKANHLGLASFALVSHLQHAAPKIWSASNEVRNMQPPPYIPNIQTSKMELYNSLVSRDT